MNKILPAVKDFFSLWIDDLKLHIEWVYSSDNFLISLFLLFQTLILPISLLVMSGFILGGPIAAFLGGFYLHKPPYILSGFVTLLGWFCYGLMATVGIYNIPAFPSPKVNNKTLKSLLLLVIFYSISGLFFLLGYIFS